MSYKNSDIRPSHDKNSFLCPHCGVVSQFINQLIPMSYKGPLTINRDPYGPRVMKASPTDFFEFFPPDEYSIKVCTNCQEITLWRQEELVYPTSSGIQPASCMPKNVKEVFEEAQSIINLSPRATCALLRVCLERLVVSLGVKGSDLYEKINNLGLSPRLKEMCDVCRLAGNEAVHREGFDFSLSNPEALALAYATSEFINQLAGEFIGVEMKTGKFKKMLEAARKQKK